ncbi:MAG: hypothetical protein K6C99_08745 [Lachnospiraceae bacterium]|nr:hypothetical protein [Lachnospiraceae bacterium]
MKKIRIVLLLITIIAAFAAVMLFFKPAKSIPEIIIRDPKTSSDCLVAARYHVATGEPDQALKVLEEGKKLLISESANEAVTSSYYDQMDELYILCAKSFVKDQDYGKALILAWHVKSDRKVNDFETDSLVAYIITEHAGHTAFVKEAKERLRKIEIEDTFQKAVEAMNNGDYEAAYGMFESLGDYRDSYERLAELADITSAANEGFVSGNNIPLDVMSSRVNKGTVAVIAVGQTDTDDGKYHLYAQQPYESGAEGIEVASVDAALNATFLFPLNKNTKDSVLFKKFTVVGTVSGNEVALSDSMYILNPEECAEHTCARHDEGLKGIFPDPTCFLNNSLEDLGVEKACYNLPLGLLCGGDGFEYEYNGRKYTFDAEIIAQYDYLVSELNKRNIQVTLVVLNNLTSDKTLIHPDSLDGTDANYYAFNTKTEAGVEKLAAIAAFLGERYSDKGFGTVDNWIIGNEVNARREWNYLPNMPVDEFAAEYEKAVRIFYNGIRSENANGNIYLCIDQEWGKANSDAVHYGGKAFINGFRRSAESCGDYCWNVTVHPYNYPLFCPTVWSQLNESVSVTHEADSPYVTMKNIDVLTDHFCKEEMLDPKGNVRSILCTEFGYTSLDGEEKQAASVAYAFRQAELNPYIDGLIFGKQTDSMSEIKESHMACGLLDPDGKEKLAYRFYKGIDREGAEEIRKQAAEIIGVDDLDSLMTPGSE